MGRRVEFVKRVLSYVLLMALAGCAQVQLGTPEPLQVDIKMKVDVEQKGEALAPFIMVP